MVLRGNVRNLARYGQTARTATSSKRTAHAAAAVLPERTLDSVSLDNDSAGPSNYYVPRAEKPSRRFNNTGAVSSGNIGGQDVLLDDHLICQTLLRLVNLPAKNRQTRREVGTSTHSDMVWKAFRELSSEIRSTLPLQTLKRVLRMVVPPPSAIRKQWQSKIERCDGSEQSLAAVTTYPYENRLQAVISAMRRSEKLSMENEDEKLGLEQELIPRLNQNLFSLNDYVFVLRQFALTGYITGSEQVVKEIDRLGMPINRKLHESRLATLSNWVSANLDIRRRFWAYQNVSRADERRFGGLSAVLARTKLPGFESLGRMPAFFPPEIARLLGDMLHSLRNKDALEYRNATLDLLLRVAKEIERPEALNAILKAGYGIDLQFPDIPESGIDVENRVTAKKGGGKRAKRGSRAEEDWVDQVTRRTSEMNQATASGTTATATIPSAASTLDNGHQSTSNPTEISVHAMNTLVDGLGTSGDVWKMLQVFEVLGNPLLTNNKAVHSPSDSATADFALTQGGSAHAKLVRRTGKVTSTSPQHDEDADPPMTLSEALQKEESSGARLSFFGLSSGSDTQTGLPNFFNQSEYSNDAADSHAGVRRAEEFQSRQPTPKAIQTDARDSSRTAHYQIMSDRAIRQVLRDLEPNGRHSYHSNTTTYQALIRHSARHAAWKMKEDTVVARAMYSLGGHFVKDAVHEMIARHNVLIGQWVHVREWVVAQRALATQQAKAMERDNGTTEGSERPSATASLSQAADKWLVAQLAAIESRKNWLRSKIHHPAIMVTAEIVTPLFQALRAGKRLDAERGRMVRMLIQDVQRCLEYLKEEWEVLTGRVWTQEKRPFGGTQSVPTPSSTGHTTLSPPGLGGESTLRDDPLLNTMDFDPIHVATDHRDYHRTFQISKHLSVLRRDLTGLERLLEEEAKRLEVVGTHGEASPSGDLVE
ncbi:hypothetical protein QFC21_007194 [Naganishia friedmannii]|uniref:Uncharacterized protein n=1 Tax=Naganishia friedmannii TaxID=89922 RepID=A0ACC2UWP7_9TREE|nr:hypothetical protein QFC21_007194 [Naganishia friedmannii]